MPENEIPFERLKSFMEMAMDEAQNAQGQGEVPVGAVLISEDWELLSKAHNCPISAMDPTAHAEINALRKAAKKTGNYRLTGTTMIVTLEPCIMCAGALVWARVKRVVFGATDPKSGALGSVLDINGVPGLNHRIEVVGGIMEKECGDILRDFFRKRRGK